MAEEFTSSNSADADKRRREALLRVKAAIKSLIDLETELEKVNLDSHAKCRDRFADMRKWLDENRQRMSNAMNDLTW